MERYISVTGETVGKLMKIFGVGDRCVRNALAYRSDSELAWKIRKAAKENGGVTYVVGEEMECFFTSDGKMKQVFPNGAELELDMSSGFGVVRMRGRQVLGYERVTVRQIREIQEAAMRLR